MSKTKYFTCFYHRILFFCSKRCQIKFNTIFDHENKHIATDHSAGINYNDFKKIYREFTKKPFNFLTIDTMLPASNPLRFRNNLLQSYKKMTMTDQIKILDRKIM